MLKRLYHGKVLSMTDWNGDDCSIRTNLRQYFTHRQNIIFTVLVCMFVQSSMDFAHSSSLFKIVLKTRKNSTRESKAFCIEIRCVVHNVHVHCVEWLFFLNLTSLFGLFVWKLLFQIGWDVFLSFHVWKLNKFDIRISVKIMFKSIRKIDICALDYFGNDKSSFLPLVMSLQGSGYWKLLWIAWNVSFLHCWNESSLKIKLSALFWCKAQPSSILDRHFGDTNWWQIIHVGFSAYTHQMALDVIFHHFSPKYCNID